MQQKLNHLLTRVNHDSVVNGEWIFANNSITVMGGG